MYVEKCSLGVSVVESRLGLGLGLGGNIESAKPGLHTHF